MTANPQKLKDVVTFEKGKPPVQQPYYGYDSEIYLTPEYLRGGPMTEPIKASSNAVRVSDGDTIVLWDGSNAGEVFRGREGVLSSTMTWLKHRGSFESDYFFYAVQHLEPLLRAQTAGSGIPHVDKEVLGKLTVLDFAKSEQTKIAQILSTMEQAIERTEAQVAKQKRIKTGLLQDLLTRGIDQHGKLRSPRTHKFKDSSLGKIPVEWEVVEAKQVCSVITKGTTPKNRSTESVVHSIPYLRVQDITTSCQINVSNELAFIDRVTHERELARSRVFPGDVLQNIVGPPLGKIAIVPPDYPEWNINQAIALFRPNDYVSSEFLYYWLQFPRTRTWFDINSKKTSGQQNLTLEHCYLVPIVLPPVEEQSQICKSLAQLVAAQTNRVNELQKLHSLKTALMQDLLTGRKRVTALLEPEQQHEKMYVAS